MSQEQPKQYTPEEIAEMEKTRTISDAELLKEGAKYVVDEKGEKRLEPTGLQKNLMYGNYEDEKKEEDLKQKRLENIERFKETLKNIAGKEDDFEINILFMHKGERSRKIGRLISFDNLEIILNTTNAGLAGKDEKEIVPTKGSIEFERQFGKRSRSSWVTHSDWSRVIDLKVRPISKD